MSRFVRLFTLHVLMVGASVSAQLAAAEPLKNPYWSDYDASAPPWKLWFQDSTPVDGIGLPEATGWLYPTSLNPHTNPFMTWDSKDAAGDPTPPGFQPAQWSGFWYMAYHSNDNGHSKINDSWTGELGNNVRHMRDGMIHNLLSDGHANYVGIRELGATLCSQSHAGLQATLINSGSNYEYMERNYFFADCVYASPFYVSWYDTDANKTTYSANYGMAHAIAPAIMQSIGRSQSETAILSKMLIASAYIRPELKERLMRHGHLPSTLMYLWKMALPWEVPYLHEIRHRPAYLEHGDTVPEEFVTVNETYHRYDETEHLRRMVAKAASLTKAPAQPILRVVSHSGGTLTYALKTAILVEQTATEAVDIEVSLDNTVSLNVGHNNLTYSAQFIQGVPGTSVTKTAHGKYRIRVPAAGGLPEGRTTVLFSANNGESDSNPATVNIYRAGAPNRRPSLVGPANQSGSPGQRVRFNMANSSDPDGSPVFLYKISGPGSISGSEWSWSIPASQAPGTYPVAIVASDRCGGESYQSREVIITVSGGNSTTGAVVMDRTSLTVSEGGTATCRVRLSKQPSANVVVNTSRSSGDGSIVIDSGASLTFTPSNWNQYQIVRLKANEDDGDNANGTASIRSAASGWTADTLTATERDDDCTLTIRANNGSVVKNPNQTYYDNGTSVQLTAQGNPGWYFREWSGAITSTNNPVSLRMSGNKTVTANYSRIELVCDTYGLVVNEGASKAFNVKLSKQPSTAVTVNLSRSGDTSITYSPASLTFTASNWNSNHRVTVLAAEDADTTCGSATLTLSAHGYLSKTLKIVEQENEGNLQIQLSGYGTGINEGTTLNNAFGIRLSARPTANVTVNLSRIGDGNISYSPSSLTFTPSNYNTYRYVHVTAAEDNNDNANGMAAIKAVASGYTMRVFEAREIDDDYLLNLSYHNGKITKNPNKTYYDKDSTVQVKADPVSGFAFNGWGGALSGMTNPANRKMTGDLSLRASFAANQIVTPSTAITVNEGGSVNLRVKLSKNPYPRSVTINIGKSGDGSITRSPSSLSFTASDWNSYKTVRIAAAEDSDTADGTARLNLTSSGFANKSVTITENDNTIVPSGNG